MLRRIMGILVASAAVLAVILPGTAHAGQSPPNGSNAAPVASGLLTLTSSMGRVVTFGYPGCPHTVNAQLERIVGFHNRPPSGCLATLVNSAGEVYPLCIGEGRVPPAFQTLQRVRVVPGISVPC